VFVTSCAIELSPTTQATIKPPVAGHDQVTHS